MKVAINTQDISQLLTSVTWSGDKSQAARKLQFEFIQDDRDSNIPIVDVDNGYRVYGADDEGEVVFVGTIYQLERDRKKSTVECTAYDDLFAANKSKTTRKYTDALPEDIAAEICAEMGIEAGDIATTGENVSFIANNKTGYQIIKTAYDEAHKKNNKQYQCIMRQNVLDVIEKGTLIDELRISSEQNMTESVYSENIEDVVNKVAITDDSGNVVEVIDDEQSQGKYPKVQAIYKQDKSKDVATEAKDLMKKPKREGHLTVIPGDYRLVAGYSVIISDANFDGQFWIKSDVHSFKNGVHETKLTLDFENLTDEVK